MSNSVLNCNDTRYKCGPLTPSACVPYTAILPTYVDASVFPCNVNIDDVFNVINPTIATILNGLNLTTLLPQCLAFNPLTVTQAQLDQLLINQGCATAAGLEALQTQFNELDISTQQITLNLQCLAPQSNPCSPNPNVYSVFFIFTTLINAICTLQTQVATLQAEVAALQS